ncbi:hypothetical protein OESDEN_19724 [Oesophagostomum dentatum]|uniref:Uncharacterized protein n=1 Tax=Oesophagostomum dentatum TaxID=61180 RepID=A0A0B1S6Q0_OESDE|nr:hypothetical protein OESDEN_19724 [Oesophagostomum dentatum]
MDCIYSRATRADSLEEGAEACQSMNFVRLYVLLIAVLMACFTANVAEARKWRFGKLKNILKKIPLKISYSRSFK